jgi:hypothetical protein
LVIDATLPGGRHIDPLTGQVPRLDDPSGPPLAPLWAAYTGRIRQLRFQHHRALFRDWLLTRHQPAPIALTVWWVREASPEPGKAKPSPLPPEEIFSVARRSPPVWQFPGAKP